MIEMLVIARLLAQLDAAWRGWQSEAMGETAIWTAILLAGQRPGRDAFAEGEGVAAKALIEVGGRPMLAQVLATLLAVPEIARVVVLAQEPAALLDAIAMDDARVTGARSGDGISGSIAALAGSAAARWPVLVTTADHPLLSADSVRALIAGAAGADVAVGMVERRVLLAAYPQSVRTWLKLADGAWTGANLFALGGPRAGRALELWAGVERDRKTAWKLFAAFGPGLFVRAITRTIGMRRALEVAGRRLGLAARLVPLAQAEAAIDVDKPADLELARAIFAAR